MFEAALTVHALDGPAHGVRVAGEFDAASCPQVSAALDSCIAEGDGDVRVDMSAVTFLDSTALTVLVKAHVRLNASGAALRISQPSPVVTRVLHLAGLLTAFDVDATDVPPL